MTTPAVRVEFSGDESALVRALRNVDAGLSRTAREAQQTQAATESMSAGMARAARTLNAATPGAAKWAAGLNALEAAENQAAQGARAMAKDVDPMAARMAQGASGSAKFAEGLRVLAAQQAKAIPATATFSTLTATLAKGLGALGITLGAVQVVRFVSDAIDAAAAMHDLSQKTGIAVETLSTLAFVGRRNDISAENLNVSFRQLAKTMGDLRGGSAEAEDAFAALGLSVRDFEGLNAEQSFVKVATALAALPDGFEKNEAASRLFGRAGADLIPLLNELAERGLPALQQAASDAGAVMSGQAAADADAFKDALDDLKGAAGGFARTLLTPVLPVLTEFFKLFTEGPAKIRATADELRKLQGLNMGGGQFESLRQAMGLGPLAAPTPAPAAPQTGGAGRSFGAPVATQKEIQALASLRDAGKLTADETARLREIVAQLNADLANTKDTEKRARIVAELASLTKDLTKTTRDHTTALTEQTQAVKFLTTEEQRLIELRKQGDAVLKAAQPEVPEVPHGPSNFDDLIRQQKERDRQQFGGDFTTGTDRAVAGLKQVQAEEDKAIDGSELLGKSLRDAIASDLADFFEHGITDAKNFGEAIGNLGRAIIKTIQDIVAQLLAAQIVQSVAGLFGGGIPAAPGGLDPGDVNLAPKGFATGGYTGAGGKYQPAGIVHAGEFVFDAETTRTHRRLFETIHAHGVDAVFPGYAEGGVVDLAPLTVRTAVMPVRGYADGGLVAAGGQHTVVLDAPEGWHGTVHSDDDTVRVIVRNRRKIAQALGVTRDNR